MLSVPDGYRFCILRQPPAGVPVRGGVVYVHPFAEEMNKSRRAVAVCAQRLADDGWAVLQVDLAGCGDSSGDIADATWSRWQDDVLQACAALRGAGYRLRVVWALRFGALVAASVLDRIEERPDLLLWQPVPNGKTHLTQFLRLKAAEEIIAQSAERGGTAALRADLRAGTPVHVAGYTLSPALADAIDAADLTLPAGYPGHVLWLETGRADLTELPPAAAQRVSALTSAGHDVSTRTVAGPAFWQTVEIEEAPALVEATVDVLRARTPVEAP